MIQGVLRIFDERNKLWSIPAAAGAVAFWFYQSRGATEGSLRGLLECLVAGGIAFVLTAAWTLTQDFLAGRRALPTRAEQQSMIEHQARNIGVLRAELIHLESGLKEYLAAKKAEGEHIRNALLDLSNDVVRLRQKDPSKALRPQLKAIADKFGELAGVRAVVSNLSGKIRRVEELMSGVDDETRTRMVSHADGGANGTKALEAEIATIRTELRRLPSQRSHSVATSAATEAVISSLRSELETNLRRGAEELMKDLSPGQLADLMGERQEERFAGLERRMMKLSKTIENLQTRMEELRFSGAGESGIPSIYRGAQGLDTSDPANKVKTGCLTKLFQANLQLRKALAA